MRNSHLGTTSAELPDADDRLHRCQLAPMTDPDPRQTHLKELRARLPGLVRAIQEPGITRASSQCWPPNTNRCSELCSPWAMS